MLKAIVKGDLIIAVVRGDVDGIPLTPEQATVPFDTLRYDGENIVFGKDYHTFYIDDNGIKHIVALDKAWQVYQGDFSDVLVKKEGKWVKQTETEAKAANAKAERIAKNAKLHRDVERLIREEYGHYALLMMQVEEARAYQVAGCPDDLSGYPLLAIKAKDDRAMAKEVLDKTLSDYDTFKACLRNRLIDKS